MSKFDVRQSGFSAAITCLAAGWLTTGAFAQADKTRASDELKGVERQLEQSGQREKQINRELSALEKEAQEISARLIVLAAKSQNGETRISVGEEKIDRLDVQQKQMVAKLAIRRDALGELLVGLQRLDRDPPPALIVHPRDVLAAIRSATLFSAIIPVIKSETTAIRRDLVVLKNLRAALLTAQKDLKTETVSLDSVQTELRALLERKKSFVRKSRTQLATEKQRTAALVAKAKNLGQLLARIREEKIAAEKLKTNAVRKAQAALRVKKLRPKVPFSKTRGQLPFPARGTILRRYAQKTQLGRASQGLLLGTRKQAQVTAPASGVVEFAGEFRSYGQLLILNVGEGYRMLLGGLGKIDVTTGQQVYGGEPVGFMGDSAARGTLISAALDVRGPVLYIEFRKNGGPVDPSAWWSPETNRFTNR